MGGISMVVLTLFWVILGGSYAISHFRHRGNAKSIATFHDGYNKLSRHHFTVQPAHRLDREEDVRSSLVHVVHADHSATAHSTDRAWDIWDHEQELDASVEPRRARYAAQYARTPQYVTAVADPQTFVGEEEEEEWVPRTYRSRRRLTFAVMAGGTFFWTVLTLMGFPFASDLLLATVVADLFVVALWAYAIYDGQLSAPRLPERPLASVTNMFESTLAHTRESLFGGFDEGEDEEATEYPETASEWTRSRAPRRAHG